MLSETENNSVLPFLFWLLFSFRGRVNRKPFIVSAFILTAAYILTAFLVNMIYPEIPSVVFVLLFLWPIAALVTKRSHDINNGVWFPTLILGAWLLIAFLDKFFPTDGSLR